VSLGRYAILVGVLLVLGLITVWGELRLFATGYEVNNLREKRSRFEEEARILERRIDAVATPDAVAARVRELRLDLRPPAVDADGLEGERR